MSPEALALAEAGLAAWRSGDFAALEQLLDPAVEWHGSEPGPWDCKDRGDVVRTLRERHEQGFPAGAIELRAVDGATVLMVSHPAAVGGPDWPEETATAIRFRGGRVVSMQDYGTEAKALAAVAQKA